MTEVNKLYESLLPETQQRLNQDWSAARYSGSGDAGNLNRHGISASTIKRTADYSTTNWGKENKAADIGTAVAAGASVGAAIGSAVAPVVGTAIGALVGGAYGLVAGVVGNAWGQRKTYSWHPDGSQSGQAWEKDFKTNAGSTFSSDPYKTSLAMMFMSPDKGDDPYRFSRDWATKRKGWNRRKVGRAGYSLNAANRPGEEQDTFVRNEAGFLDWKNYNGSGPGRFQNFAPTWIENMLSRSLYARHEDLWQKENNRAATWQNQNLNLAGRDEEFSSQTGNIRRSDLGKQGG